MKKELILIVITFLIIGCSPNKYNGIDVSHHNNICWECIEKDKNIKFCYIKATEGKHYRDSKCLINNSKARKLNLETGLYHYFRTNVSVIKQFENFNNVYNKCNSTLIPMIDVENEGNNFSNIYKVNNDLKQLINLFYNEYKVYPIIYLDISHYKDLYPSIRKCKIWFGISNKSKYFPSTITQTKIGKIGCNNIDLNYCRNINSIIINEI